MVFSPRKQQIANEPRERRSTSPIIREMHIKTSMGYRFIADGWINKTGCINGISFDQKKRNEILTHVITEMNLEDTACVLRCLSHVRLCVTLWTVAHQASPSMKFSRQ